MGNTEPLSFIAAILGAGGLGIILRIVLNFVRRSQEQSNDLVNETRLGFERVLEANSEANRRFLENHMSANRLALENLVEATDRMAERMGREHEQTRALIRERDQAIRDSHRRMALSLTQTKTTSKRVGQALEIAIDEMGNGA
jgi:DNA anti-recombination protein RmuC